MRARSAVASAMLRKRVDPGQVDARNVEPSLAGAGRQDQMAVADRPAVGERHPMRGPVDPDRADAETQVDAAVAVEGFGPERQAVQLHLALQKSLGERRALIGQLPLVGQEDDLAVIAALRAGWLRPARRRARRRR